MSEFLDAVQFHQNTRTGKWRKSNLGYAKPNKNGDGWDIYLDALPMPSGDGCRISLVPKREQQGGGAPPRQDDDLDSAIPF